MIGAAVPLNAILKAPRTGGARTAVTAVLGCLLQVVQLLTDEANITLVPSNLSITSLNFYRGDATAAAAFLRKRVFALVAVNPWLCARAVKRPGAPWHNCCELWVPLRPNHKRVLVELVSETLAPGMVRCWPRESFARASTASELDTFPHEKAFQQ